MSVVEMSKNFKATNSIYIFVLPIVHLSVVITCLRLTVS